MRKLIFFLVAVLAMPTAYADSGDSIGWYLGGGIAMGNVFLVEGDGIYESSVRGSSDTGFVVNGGYRWSRYIAYELGYVDGGAPDFDQNLVLLGNPPGIYSTDISQETTAIEVSAIGVFPFWNRWEVYIKTGVAIWEATSDQVLVPLAGGAAIVRQVDSDGTDFMLGIGAGVNIGKNLHTRLEYQAFRTNNKLLSAGPGQEARFDLVSLVLHWRFGSNR